MKKNHYIKLSIIIPCYNEKRYIKKIVQRIIKEKINCEILIIDDFSNDGSKEIISKLDSPLISKKIFHNKNCGKGEAIISALKFVKGDAVLIQDADLEYNPKDIKKMIDYINKNNCSAIYGSRFLHKNYSQLCNIFPGKLRIYGNYILTKISNILNKQSLSDAHTCYKMISTNVLKNLRLCEKGFSFCTEVNTKLSNRNIKIFEVPISYKGRDYSGGKKIKTRDFFYAIWTIIYYKFKNL